MNFRKDELIALEDLQYDSQDEFKDSDKNFSVEDGIEAIDQLDKSVNKLSFVI